MTETTTATAADATIVSRPTNKSEWTLIGALGAAWLLALAYGAVLTFPHWTDSVAADRIHFLGWALLISLFVIGLVVVAIISPWVGTVKASGMGADLEINGTGTEANP